MTKVTYERFQLDKKIPIATLILIAIYTASAIWYASSLNSRVGAIETKQQNGINSFERLIKLETNQDNLKETLKDALNEMRGSINRIDTNVQKLTEKKESR